MFGIAQGEASSLAHPTLQLFVRAGGFLTDLVAGTYQIQDIHNPAVAPVTVVAPTALTAADTVATGVYALTTGNTAAWRLGTHRVVCRYQLSVGGAEAVQVVEFEVLDSGDFVVGQSYVGYVSTRRMYQDEFVGPAVLPATLHRLIMQASRQIEVWTGRWFHPRYVQAHLREPRESHILSLDAPIVAIGSVESSQIGGDGSETLSAYQLPEILVYNRHLDGAPYADQDNPKLVRIPAGWSRGWQSIRVSGVFGYTEADQDPSSLRTLLGHTPEDIGQVVATLTTRYLSSAGQISHQALGLIKKWRTADQTAEFFDSRAGGGGGSGGATMSGDPAIDIVLTKYMRPVTICSVGDSTWDVSASVEFKP